MAMSQPKISYKARKATLEDIPVLRDLIDQSVRTLQQAYYAPEVITNALESVYGVDTTLINDSHYFVISPESSSSTIIACGGWSNRTTLYGGDQYNARDPTLLNPKTDAAKIRAMFVHPEWAGKGVGRVLIGVCEEAAREAGFTRAEMGATLSGVGFYERLGYAVIEEQQVDFQDGAVMKLKRMGKTLS